MGLRLSMLLGTDKATQFADHPSPSENGAHLMPRVALGASGELCARLEKSAQFEFIPFGKGGPLSETDAILIQFNVAAGNVSEIVDEAAKGFPNLPCFILCSLNDQKKVSQYGWQVIAVRDMGSLPEIEEKLQRALFLFPWLRCSTLRKILGALKTIPAEAVSHQRIVRELQNPQFSLEHVAKLIQQDPALTAQLLKMVNSAAFLRGRPVHSVNEAVSILGAVKLQALIASAWAFFLINDDACPGFHPKKEWEHAVDIAERVRRLCDAEGVESETAETAIIAALLHDLGKVMLAANLPEDYAAVLQKASLNPGQICQIEFETFGFTHAEVGGCLLALWGVPLTVAEAVMLHHRDDQSVSSAASLIQKAHVPPDDPAGN